MSGLKQGTPIIVKNMFGKDELHTYCKENVFTDSNGKTMYYLGGIAYPIENLRPATAEDILSKYEQKLNELNKWRDDKLKIINN